jgi:hypothetical protein
MSKGDKPSIDWREVPFSFRYLWLDQNGTGYVSVFTPYPGMRSMYVSGEILPAEQFPSFKYGNCKWKESIVYRSYERTWCHTST